MKQLYGLLVLVGVGTACQQQPPSTKAALVSAKTNSVAAHLASKSGRQPTAGLATPEMASASGAMSVVGLTPSNVLQRYDLSALWQGAYDAEASQNLGPMDGFFGHDYRRIAFVFTEIHRDSLRPTVYWVKGKTRFQKAVSAFEGAINIKSVAHLKPGLTVQEAGLLDVENLSSVFTAKATFEFREQPGSNTTGVFTGTGYLDFFIDSDGNLHSAMSMMEASPAVPAKGAGVLYNGKWVSYTAGASKPLLVSGNVFITAPLALSHFSIGDRDPSFNPKYAKLGWNDYWANDEWWADTPKSGLNL
jgi:hypothetical protein